MVHVKQVLDGTIVVVLLLFTILHVLMPRGELRRILVSALTSSAALWPGKSSLKSYLYMLGLPLCKNHPPLFTPGIFLE